MTGHLLKPKIGIPALLSLIVLAGAVVYGPLTQSIYSMQERENICRLDREHKRVVGFVTDKTITRIGMPKAEVYARIGYPLTVTNTTSADRWRKLDEPLKTGVVYDYYCLNRSMCGSDGIWGIEFSFDHDRLIRWREYTHFRGNGRWHNDESVLDDDHEYPPI